MADWELLDAELALWRQPATLWWRDDDAVTITPKLERLFSLSQQAAVPLLLAVIPLGADVRLAERVLEQEVVWVGQHGCDHCDNSFPEQRKIEMGGRLDADSCLQRLLEGRSRLLKLFGERYLDILVPPWNRVDPEHLQRISTAGYRRISMLGSRIDTSMLPQLNVHVDIIDWKKGSYAGDGYVLSCLVDHLRARRTGLIDMTEPSGIMSHHLQHDEGCWCFLHQFFQHVAARDKLVWLGGESLVEA